MVNWIRLLIIETWFKGLYLPQCNCRVASNTTCVVDSVGHVTCREGREDGEKEAGERDTQLGGSVYARSFSQNSSASADSTGRDSTRLDATRLA